MADASNPATGETVLSLRGITKQFGAVSALSGIDLDVRAGEVVALVGDNGAGKSTLVKVLAGVFQATSGEMSFRGKPVTLAGPGDALSLGIATVFQDLALSTSSPTSSSGARWAAWRSTRSRWSCGRGRC